MARKQRISPWTLFIYTFFKSWIEYFQLPSHISILSVSPLRNVSVVSLLSAYLHALKYRLHNNQDGSLRYLHLLSETYGNPGY